MYYPLVQLRLTTVVGNFSIFITLRTVEGTVVLWPWRPAADPATTLMKSRRRSALPEAQTVRLRFAITARICVRWNGVQGSVCTAVILSRSCPLWVKSGHRQVRWRFLFCAMSASGEDMFNVRSLAWFDWQRELKCQIRAELYRLVQWARFLPLRFSKTRRPTISFACLE